MNFIKIPVSGRDGDKIAFKTWFGIQMQINPYV